MVPQGWAELVAWMQERSAAGALDVEAVWVHFRALAATSEQAGLPALVARFDAAPTQDRLALAGTIAGMLGSVEWPVAWREPGQRLVRAVSELIGAAAKYLMASSPGEPIFRLENDMIRHGQEDLEIAHRMLRSRCRRDDLQLVAALCSRGTAALSAFVLRHARALDELEQAARLQVAVALGAYVEAARAMNDVCGVVLFKYVDVRINKETSG